MKSARRLCYHWFLWGLALGLCLVAKPAVAQAEGGGALTVYIFASSTCEDCRQLKETDIPAITALFGTRVMVEFIAVDSAAAFARQLQYERYYGIRDESAIKAFVGKRAFAGAAHIRMSLATAIEEALQNQERTPALGEVAAASAQGEGAAGGETSLIRQRYVSLRAATIAAAGLADGINPCAFVTLIFFVSVLSLLKKTPRQILLVGGVFTGTVFLTYFFTGLGLFHALKAITSVRSAGRWLTLFSAGLAWLLGSYHALDAVRYVRSGNTGDIGLRLPEKLRRRINHLIQQRLRTRHIVWAAAGLGVSVSLLETVCTGQLYVPTIVFMMEAQGVSTKALGYLVMYNVFFIAPLLGVFGAAYAGLRSATLARFFQDHLALVKFVMAGVFWLLGGLLWMSSVR